MEFAIVDIETTGGYAAANGITEVAIHIYDGKQVISTYETLINPGCDIPYYIRGLTGINNEMVANAPAFGEVADEIYALLKDRVFVAHSVNFDYSFLKQQLAACGYELNTKKLCTIRLSRKILPGAPSYSLGNLCGFLGIPIQNRHRAGGDTAATVQLFEMLLQKDSENIIEKSLKKNSKEQSLPPNLPKEQFENLPNSPGVYYFKNSKGKVVYVGKAKSIKKRVSSHFANNSAGKQKQEFMRAIHAISYEICGSELMALVLEAHEIKRLWPAFNRAQKHFEFVFGIVDYHDQLGYRRIAINKVVKGTKPLISCTSMLEGFTLLRNLTENFELCPRLTGIATDMQQCIEKNCACNEKDKKSVAAYNKRVRKAVNKLTQTESLVITGLGRTAEEKSVVVIEEGTFTRMGYLAAHHFDTGNLNKQVIETIPVYKENFNIRSIIAGYRRDYPERVYALK